MPEVRLHCRAERVEQPREEIRCTDVERASRKGEKPSHPAEPSTQLTSLLNEVVCYLLQGQQEHMQLSPVQTTEL